MYGIILSAIAEVIKERYGLDFWKLINPSCGDSIGDSDGTFISRLFYDDELTYQLINNAERILRSEKYGQLSQLFGERFFELVCDSGYESILRLLGGNLKDFLDNLDSFHTHLSTTYSRMKPPSFRCSHMYQEEYEEFQENSGPEANQNTPNNDNDENNNTNSCKKKRKKIPDKLILHYYSERAGLEGIVMGMVKAAARELFSIGVELTIDKIRLIDQGIDHTEFTITILGPLMPKRNSSSSSNSSQEGLRTSNASSNTNTSTILNRNKSQQAIPRASKLSLESNDSISDEQEEEEEQEQEEEQQQLENIENQPPNVEPESTNFLETSMEFLQQQLMEFWPTSKPVMYEDEEFTYKNVTQLAKSAMTSKVSPLVFAQALPFHLIFDRSLVIRQAGTSILRVIPAINTRRNVKLADVMHLLEPKCLKGKVSFENILKYKNSVYVFRPDEKQVISGGHRHLHMDYLRSLKDAEKQSEASSIPMNQLKTTGNHQAGSQLKVTAIKASVIGSIAPAERPINERPINTKRQNPTTIDESLWPSCALPEADIDKYIVKLMGQMIFMKDKDLMLFICSPSVANLDDLNNTGLFLSDIPLHDATRDLVLLSEQFEAEYKVQENLTTLTEQLNVMKCELEEEKKKTDRLLYSVLPPTVANELRNNRPVPAKRYQHVSILFSGIVGFTDFCARNSDSSGAIRIVNLLNKIYTTFDVLTEPKRNPFVYKVETVGDKYMAVSGLPEACDSHARHINKLALDIQDLARTIKLEEYTGIKKGAKDDENQQIELTQMDQCDHLRVTIGIHCGEVVTGVIGKRTPRYCLFGNTVNLTSRCETTGKKGAINVSQDVYNLCSKDPNNFDSSFEFTLAGQVNMKGKSEPMRMWYLTRRVI